MRRLLLDRLFVPVRDGVFLTRPHGWFGPWRRITGEQKDRLTALYRCAAEGVVLMFALGVYRAVFGNNVDYDDLFNAAGFMFGMTIFMTQTWLLGDSPEVSGPAHKTPDPGRAGKSLLPPDFANACVIIAAFLLSTAVLAVGLILHDTALLVGGSMGAFALGLALRRMMLRLWRSRR